MFDSSFEPDNWGWHHENDLPCYDNCREQLERLVNAAYQTGDMEQLQDALDNLTLELDMRLPTTPLCLQSKQQQLSGRDKHADGI